MTEIIPPRKQSFYHCAFQDRSTQLIEALNEILSEDVTTVTGLAWEMEKVAEEKAFATEDDHCGSIRIDLHTMAAQRDLDSICQALEFYCEELNRAYKSIKEAAGQLSRHQEKLISSYVPQEDIEDT